MTRRRGATLGLGLDVLDLALGDGFTPSAEDAWRVAWERHRAEMLDPDYLARIPGVRPWAWWAFDCPDDVPAELIANGVPSRHQDLDALRFLAEHGLLLDVERDALLARETELHAAGDSHRNLARARALADIVRSTQGR